MLPKKDEIKPSGLNNVALYKHCAKVLKESGFVRLTEVKDLTWLTKTAKLKNPHLPLYHKGFAEMITAFVDTDTSFFINKKLEAYKARPLYSYSAEKEYRLGKNTTAKIFQKYGRRHRVELADKIMTLVVSPCRFCLGNSTKHLNVLSCC